MIEVPTSFFYLVAASQAQAAYLMASFTNSSPYTLLPSEAAKVFVGACRALDWLLKFAVGAGVGQLVRGWPV